MVGSDRGCCERKSHSGAAMAIIGRNLQSLNMHGPLFETLPDGFGGGLNTMGDNVSQSLSLSQCPLSTPGRFKISPPNLFRYQTFFRGLHEKADATPKRNRIQTQFVSHPVKRATLAEGFSTRYWARHSNIFIIRALPLVRLNP